MEGLTLKALRLLFITAAIVLPLNSSHAAPETLAEFKSAYFSHMMKLADQHSADMAPFLVSYSNYLDVELDKSVNTGDIKKYEKLEQEKKRFENEKTIPPDSIFQKSVAQVEAKHIAILHEFSVKYVSALKAHQISLMKAQNIDGAKDVQKEIDEIQTAINGYASQLPALTSKKEVAGGPAASKMGLSKPAVVTSTRKITELITGNSAYDNYAYPITGAPKELEGYFFTQLTKRKESAFEFEVKSGGIVYSFGYGPPDDKWKEAGWNIGVNLNGNMIKLKVYKRELIEGTYTMPAGMWLILPKSDSEK